MFVSHHRWLVLAGTLMLAAALSTCIFGSDGDDNTDASAQDAGADGLILGDGALPTDSGQDPLAIGEFVPFVDTTGKQLYFDYVQMVSATRGFATSATFAKEFELYRTDDGGASWSSLGLVQTDNTAMGASYQFSAYPDDLWFTTFFSGFGIDGSMGVSTDEGTQWTRLDDTIQTLYEGYNVPLSSLVNVLDRGLLFVVVGENKASLSFSSDGGGSWQRRDLDAEGVQGVSLRATDSQLFLWGNTSSSSDDWAFYRYDLDAGSLVDLTAGLPGDFWPERWYASSSGALTLLDSEGSRTPTYQAMVSSDGGQSFATLYSHGQQGDDQEYFLQRAFGRDGQVGYICLVKYGSVQIRGTIDGGQSFETLYDGGAENNVYYFQTDYAGNVFAIRYSTYSTGLFRLGL